jgi:hypothetical protein
LIAREHDEQIRAATVQQDGARLGPREGVVHVPATGLEAESRRKMRFGMAGCAATIPVTECGMVWLPSWCCGCAGAPNGSLSAAIPHIVRVANTVPPADPLVVALLYDGLCAFEFSIVAAVFALYRPEMGQRWYRLLACAEQPNAWRARACLDDCRNGR